jgi:hypothetical protein
VAIEEAYLTPRQVAKLLQVSTAWVYRTFAGVRGVIDLGSPETMHKRQRRFLRIPRSVLNQFLAEMAGSSTPVLPRRSLTARQYDPSHIRYPRNAHRKYAPCQKNPSGFHYWHPNGTCRSCGLERDEVRLQRHRAGEDAQVETNSREYWTADDVAEMLNTDRADAIILLRDLPGATHLSERHGSAPMLCISQEALVRFLLGRLVEPGREGEAIVKQIIATATQRRVEAQRMHEDRPDTRCECGRRKESHRDKCDVCWGEAQGRLGGMQNAQKEKGRSVDDTP